MKYDDMVKMILESDELPAGLKTFSLNSPAPERKSNFEYVPRTHTSYSSEDISKFWTEIEDTVGRATINTDEDLKKYTNLTDKVLIINAYSPYPAAIPAPIAQELFLKNQDAIEKNINQYSSVLRKYADMAGVDWPVTSNHPAPIYITPIKGNITLPQAGDSASDEQIEALKTWADWLKQKRQESWIIADTGFDNLIIK